MTKYNLWLIHIYLKVFDHDWFATPFVMLTCQVSTKNLLQSYVLSCIIQGTGVFDDPPWEGYSCVLRESHLTIQII